MDPNQQQTILQAIAVSALHIPGADRSTAFRVLQDLKTYENRIPLCIAWLHTEKHTFVGSGGEQQQQYDITTATKLLALEIIDNFLVTGYAKCADNERVALRQAVLKAARLLVTTTQTSNATTATTTRILARKLAHVLKGLVLRDFPQRWPNLAQDLFAGMEQGGLWTSAAAADEVTGVKICLECFKLVAEDCTDADFNVKISTTRRNDVLTGLNEISPTFLPLFFQLLERNYPILQQSKQALHNMHQFLLSENRTIHNMTEPESAAYRVELKRRDEVSLLLADTVVTLEKFCTAMPVNWMVGGDIDFVAAFLHFLREPAGGVQCRALDCLEQLASRGKLDFHQWMRLVTELPAAFQEANQQFQSSEWEHRTVEARASADSDGLDALALQLEFHRGLSRLLASIMSAGIGQVTSNKDVLACTGPFYEKINAFFRLLVDMLHHPSGRILTEQVGMWANLYRDPQICRSRLLQPFASELMTCYMDHMVKIRWEDVENETHPQTKLMEASFDDEEDFDAWMQDLRSRASRLFKLIGNTEPKIASQVLNARVQILLANHGNGAPLNLLDSTNQQLTMKSDAVIQFEGIAQPLENTLGGIPSWAMLPSAVNIKDDNDRKREGIRQATRVSLLELCNALVNWKPTYLWLKFRHASLLEALKHYWKHDPSTLLQGVDTLIRYLGLADEWTYPSSSSSSAPAVAASARMSDEIVGLKKRSGYALVVVAKQAPHHLVPWLSQLSQATKSLLSSGGLIPMNQMHLYEFLSCVATAVENPQDRSNFIAEVLSGGLIVLESAEVQQSIQSASTLLAAFGVSQAAERPETLTEPANVERVLNFYRKLFTPLNQLLSVGRRCNEAARKKTVIGGVSIENLPPAQPGFGEPGQPAFPPDEGPLSVQELAINDPFAPLWPRIIPTVLQIYEAILSVWRPEFQASMLQNRYQRYVYAISDDEAFLAKSQNTKTQGGVFGEGGTAGSVVAGTDRRDLNLVPKWSGWFNELRSTCFQLLGLFAGQRVLYAPEVSSLYPRVVAVLTDPLNLKSMEHRHFTHFLKHVVELVLLSCPCSLYKTHLEPIIGPIMDHMRYRLEKTWLPVFSGTNSNNNGVPATKALCSADCGNIAQIASRGEEEWFSWYYAHAGLFVGDLDQVTSEAAVDKHRVEISRSFCDVLQSALALKGDWALVLANQAKEELAQKKNDSSILLTGPRNSVNTDGSVAVNADGTPKLAHQAAIDARKLLRINGLCHFLLLESESIAGNLTLTVIQCLGYPDAYTCRRNVKICHRVLETVAWSPQYSLLLGQQMFTQAVKNLVTEPKWMVGMEWEMINVVRDIYCRLALGQILHFGGQGIGQQQPDGQNGIRYEQAKSADQPLHGGGILVQPSDTPRQILASLPGIGTQGVQEFENTMKTKRSAKDQKDCIRDLLRVAADNLLELNPAKDDGSAAAGIFDRAVQEESLLHINNRTKTVADIPEKLVINSPKKKMQTQNEEAPAGAAWLFD